MSFHSQQNILYYTDKIKLFRSYLQSKLAE